MTVLSGCATDSSKLPSAELAVLHKILAVPTRVAALGRKRMKKERKERRKHRSFFSPSSSFSFSPSPWHVRHYSSARAYAPIRLYSLEHCRGREMGRRRLVSINSGIYLVAPLSLSLCRLEARNAKGITTRVRSFQCVLCVCAYADPRYTPEALILLFLSLSRCLPFLSLLTCVVHTDKRKHT